MANRGRPRKLTSAIKAKKLINKYFQDCKINDEPITYCGYALALGFSKRDTVAEYIARNDDLSGPIAAGAMRVQKYYESLLSKAGCNGAIFALKNYGWRDKQEHDVTTQGQPINRLEIQVASTEARDSLYEAVNNAIKDD